MQALPSRVGIVGGGRMGAGIAHAFLLAGSEVVLVEVDMTHAELSVSLVKDSLEQSAQRGLLSESMDRIKTRLRATCEYTALAQSDLVVEAIPEQEDLKRRVLGEVGNLIPREAVLATNTSSLSVNRLAEAVPNPDRFIGLHFFNPVAASQLVEIVIGKHSDPAVVEQAEGWARVLGKTPITVRDSPGFATSRLGVAIGLEAIRMLEDGVASAEDIDAAMVLGYKHPIGPLRLTDLVGLDVRLSVAEHLTAELGPRFAPPALLRQKVFAGELGRKTGRGFYSWPD